MARTDYGAILSTKIADTSQAIRDVEQTVGLIAPADWGSRIRAMHSSSDYDNVMAQLVEETTTPASIASFTDGANNLPVKELICTINPTETGTGAKSPSNPYVIGGHTEINVTQRGKNLTDLDITKPSWYSGNWLGTTLNDNYGINQTRSNSMGGFGGIVLRLGAGSYIVSAEISDTSATYLVGIFYSVDGVTSTQLWVGNLSKTGTTVYRAFTIPNDAEVAIRISIGSFPTGVTSVDFNNLQVETGSTITEFEPYNGQTHTVSFGQTVYGGSLNVTTGVLTLTSVCKNLGEYTFTRLAYQDIYYFYAVFSDRLIASENVMCEIFKYKGSGASTLTSNYDMARAGQNYRFYFRADECTTSESFHELVNGYKIYYELETPIVIQLDPIEVRTLLGSNNIYHDCNGNTKVTYRANGALYVAQH